MDLPQGSLKEAFKAVRATAQSSGKRRKFSTKNTVSGVLVAVVAEQALLNGLDWPLICLAFVAVLPLLFAR